MRTRGKSPALSGMKCMVVLLLTLVIPRASTQSQTQFTVDFFYQPLAKLHLSVLVSSHNPQQYDRLAEHLQVLDTSAYKEKLIIFRLGIENLSEKEITTTLGDLFIFTDRRHLFSCYLVEDPQAGPPTFNLPEWSTQISTAGGQTTWMRLAMIVPHGSHGDVENSSKIWAMFSHEEVRGVRYCLAFASVTINAEGPAEPKPNITENSNRRSVEVPVNTFAFGANLNPISARELLAPHLPLYTGAPDALMRGLAGRIDVRKPYWAGIAEAVAQTNFDYDTGVRYLTKIVTLVRSHPDQLCLPSVFLAEPKVIVTSFADYVLFSNSLYQPSQLPHRAGEILLYIFLNSQRHNLHPSLFAPVPGTFQEKEPSGGFTLKTVGDFTIDVSRVAANQFHIQLRRADNGVEGESNTFELVYLRRGEY